MEEEGRWHLAESFFAIFELLVGILELLPLLVHFGLEVFELGFARLELLLFLLDGQFGFGQILELRLHVLPLPRQVLLLRSQALLVDCQLLLLAPELLV